MSLVRRIAGSALLVACRAPPSPATQTTVADAASEARAQSAVVPEVREVEAPADMLLVPAGTFTMGSDAGGEEDEHPAHTVTLAAFFLDHTPITNAAYQRCIDSKACRLNDRTIASRKDAGSDASFLAAQHPVVGVSWDDAKAYCAWAGKRLPREAEYERAMRGDDGRKYAWGNEPPTAERAAVGRVLGWVGSSTDDVGAHPAGRGPYGHDDLAGNVWEWCEDAYDPYAYRRVTAPQGIAGSCAEITATQDELRTRGLQGFTGSNPIPTECERVLRGGAFNYEPSGLRATNRVHHPARYRMLMAGFRCAKDVAHED
jgi:formylglycine-generating enzyme required for sulfatase activity